MPPNTTIASAEHQDFCRALKAARERKGLALDQIAAATKIPASLFEGLEHGDVRQWPTAIFRRAYFREYARLVDLPAMEWCDEFIRLFPDGDTLPKPKPSAPPDAAAGTGDLRMVLDITWADRLAAIRSRVGVALADLVIVVVISMPLAWLAGLQLTTAIAATALLSSFVATACAMSPARWWIDARASTVPRYLTRSRVLRRMRGRHAPLADAIPEPHVADWSSPRAVDRGAA